MLNRVASTICWGLSSDRWRRQAHVVPVSADNRWENGNVESLLADYGGAGVRFCVSKIQ